MHARRKKLPSAEDQQGGITETQIYDALYLYISEDVLTI